MEDEDKPWTETEAWAYLAECCDEAVARGGYVIRSPKTSSQHFGLCGLVDTLRWRCFITRDVAAAMIAKLPPTIESGIHSGYCWPCDPIGAKPRAEFCKAMTAKLEGAA